MHHSPTTDEGSTTSDHSDHKNLNFDPAQNGSSRLLEDCQKDLPKSETIGPAMGMPGSGLDLSVKPPPSSVPSSQNGPMSTQNGPVTSGPPGGYHCQECGVTLPTWQHFKQHQEVLHSGNAISEPMKCVECRELFADEASLQEHIMANHCSGTSTGNQGIIKTEEDPSGGRPKSESDPGLLNGPMDQSSGTAPGTTNGEGKVFNAEAYCEICNKEFCNKYFLRTHKANKHGIQMPNTTPGRGPGSRSKSSITPPVSNHQHSNAQNDHMSQVWNGNLFGALGPGSLGLPSNLKPEDLSPHHLPLDLAAMQQFASALDPLKLGGAGSNPPSMPKAQMPDAFCPLCQQRFPNAYMLQSHFFAVHNPLTQAASMYSMPDLLFRSLAQTATFNPSGLLAPPMTSATSLPLDFSRAVAPNLVTSVPSLLSGQAALGFSGVPGLKNPTDAFASITTLATSNAQLPSSAINSASAMTPTTPAPMSKDSFCELCQKEFCNKYFLRTHKFNKHGIVVPETPQSGGGPGSGLGKNGSPTTSVGSNATAGGVSPVQEMPLKSNFAGENSPPDEGPGPKRVKRELSMDFEANGAAKVNNFSGMNLELDCCQCGERFKTPYALAAHKFQCQCYGENAKNEAPLVPPGDLMPGDVPPGVDPEAYCEFCRKEFCSKYFLKTHKLNIHGMAMDLPTQVQPPSMNLANVISGNLEQNAPNTSNTIPMTSPMTPVSCATGQFGFQLIAPATRPAPPPPAVAPPMNTTPAAPKATKTGSGSSGSGKNFCDICNKELCNKYFLRTHMAKMHGLKIDENKTVIGTAEPTRGGYNCDICGKELSSRHFLKMHRLNAHGIQDDRFPGPPSQVGMLSNLPPMLDPVFMSSINPLLPQNQPLSSLDHGLHTQPPHSGGSGSSKGDGITWEPSGGSSSPHSEGSDPDPDKPPPFLLANQTNHIDQSAENGSLINMTSLSASTTSSHVPYREICGVCNRRFKSIKWLRTHMWTEHGSVLTAGPVQPVDPPENGDGPENLSTKTPHDSPPASGMSDRKPTPSGSSRKVQISANGNKMYRCAYCPYATRWLSNLCVHEKRHTGGAGRRGSNPGDEPKTYTCHVCLRSYRYQHSLQRHMSCHKYLPPSLLSRYAQQLPQSQNPRLATTSGDPSSTMAAPLVEQNRGMTSPVKPIALRPGDRLITPVKSSPDSRRFRCTACQKVFHSREVARVHFLAVHRRALPPGPPSASPRKVYKCKLCGHSARVYDQLRQHLMQEHKITPKSKLQAAARPNNPDASPSPTKSPKWDQTGRKSDGSTAHQGALVPRPPSKEKSPLLNNSSTTAFFDGNYMMQPFVMKETTQSGAFVSSMVYLPVCREVKGPIEASFTFVPLPSNVPLPYPFA